MAITSTDLCGQQIGGGSTSFTFQPTVSVPATDMTDPSAGATVMMLCVQFVTDGGNTDDTGITDDAEAVLCEDDYSNIYTGGGCLQSFGGFCGFHTYFSFVGAPLVAGVTNITASFATNASFVAVTGRVYTGVQYNAVVGDPMVNNGNAIAALIGGGSETVALGWEYPFGGASAPDAFILAPFGAGSPSTNWQWSSGDLAAYMICWANDSPNGAWTWNNPDIVTVTEYDDIATGSGGFSTIVYAEQDISGLTPLVCGTGGLDGSFAGTEEPNVGGGFGWIAGLGPTCPPPPPATNNPVFAEMFRSA